MANMPYPSFELIEPLPSTRVPRDAVAFWLKSHQGEIVGAERKFSVSRVAIAGVIAWEALQNPQILSIKSSGPGKMHLQGKDGTLSWPEAVELPGKMPALAKAKRERELARPKIAILYIGATLDLIAEAAERKGWNIRNSPSLLGHVYHSKGLIEWPLLVDKKPLTAAFLISPGGMGQWIEANKAYLEDAVGKSEVP